jgi:hypothetical protein
MYVDYSIGSDYSNFYILDFRFYILRFAQVDNRFVLYWT